MKPIRNSFAYATTYLAFALPTYILPYFGSNSSTIHALASGAGRSGAIHILSLIHLSALAALIYTARLRSLATGRSWLPVLPSFALAFDFLPGLSLIPFIPTIFHISAIIFGVMGTSNVQLKSDSGGEKRNCPKPTKICNTEKPDINQPDIHISNTGLNEKQLLTTNQETYKTGFSNRPETIASAVTPTKPSSLGIEYPRRKLNFTADYWFGFVCGIVLSAVVAISVIGFLVLGGVFPQIYQPQNTQIVQTPEETKPTWSPAVPQPVSPSTEVKSAQPSVENSPVPPAETAQTTSQPDAQLTPSPRVDTGNYPSPIGYWCTARNSKGMGWFFHTGLDNPITKNEPSDTCSDAIETCHKLFGKSCKSYRQGSFLILGVNNVSVACQEGGSEFSDNGDIPILQAKNFMQGRHGCDFNIKYSEQLTSDMYAPVAAKPSEGSKSNVQSQLTDPPILGIASGKWDGEYRYKTKSNPPVTFSMELAQFQGGVVRGTINEPRTTDPAVYVIHASVVGNVDGRHIHFLKTYDGWGGLPINYDGIFDAEGKTMSGHWALSNLDTGDFHAAKK